MAECIQVTTCAADDPDSGHHSTPVDPLGPGGGSSGSASDCSDLPEDWTPSKMKYPDFARKISYHAELEVGSGKKSIGKVAATSVVANDNLRVRDVVKKPGCEMFVIGFDGIEDPSAKSPTGGRGPKNPPFTPNHQNHGGGNAKKVPKVVRRNSHNQQHNKSPGTLTIIDFSCQSGNKTSICPNILSSLFGFLTALFKISDE